MSLINVDPGTNKLWVVLELVGLVSTSVWRWPWCDVCGRALDKAAFFRCFPKSLARAARGARVAPPRRGGAKRRAQRRWVPRSGAIRKAPP